MSRTKVSTLPSDFNQSYTNFSNKKSYSKQSKAINIQTHSPKSISSRPRKQEQRRSHENSIEESVDIMSNLQIDKKGKVNLNHLLSFQFPPRQSGPASTPNFRRKKNVYVEPFNKERFINANYRFIMNQEGDYSVNLADPDTLVDWKNVIQVIMSSGKDNPSCPICLSPPKAAKVTKCGHVYCWPCIAHYLHLGENKWRKCPICYDSIYIDDLKSVCFASVKQLTSPTSQSPMSLKMFLMKRQLGSAICLPKTGFATWETSAPPLVTNSFAFPFAKLLLSTASYQAEMHQVEISELESLLAETEPVMTANPAAYVPGLTPSPVDHPISERPFIEKALSEARQQKLKCLESKNNNIKKIESAGLNETSYYFYQSSDGQHLYMHPLDIKILKYEFKEYSSFPEKIHVDITHVEESTLDDDLRKRCKYLSHLPLGCDVNFCEVDLRGIVGQNTLDIFENELKQRVERRLTKARKEEMEKNRKEKLVPTDPLLFEPIRQVEEGTFEEQFPLPQSSSIQSSPITNLDSNVESVWNKSSSFVRNASAKFEDDYQIDEDMGWTLDLEEAVLTKDLFTDDLPSGSLNFPKKKGKKNQVLLVSNSGGRRRY